MEQETSNESAKVQIKTESTVTPPSTAATTSTANDPTNHSEASPVRKTQSPPGANHQQQQHHPATAAESSAMDEDNMDNMDFEEISDEELEEEVRVKGLGDALGVDWASLVAESRPRLKPEKTGSAKRRWESHNVLINLGISVEMAGEDLVRDILEDHRRAESHEESKCSSGAAAAVAANNGIKVEVKQEYVEEEEIFEASAAAAAIEHPMALMQVALRQKADLRKALFASAGPHRRALSARRDLTIRRYLCNLPLNDVYAEPRPSPDPDLLKQASLLMERCL